MSAELLPKTAIEVAKGKAILEARFGFLGLSWAEAKQALYKMDAETVKSLALEYKVRGSAAGGPTGECARAREWPHDVCRGRELRLIARDSFLACASQTAEMR